MTADDEVRRRRSAAEYRTKSCVCCLMLEVQSALIRTTNEMATKSVSQVNDADGDDRLHQLCSFCAVLPFCVGVCG